MSPGPAAPSNRHARATGGEPPSAQVFVGAGVSILPAAYAEMFPARIRTIGLAVPYPITVAAFGGTAPYLQRAGA